MTHHFSVFAALVCISAMAFPLMAQCPDEPPLANYTGTGATVCPCFIAGEEAGAVFEAPAEHYPIEILRFGIGWASQFGGGPQSLEQAIHVYENGLPAPGTPIFTLEGPVLTDGYINEFNLEPFAGEIIVDSGPFAITLEFLNANSGNIYAPSVYSDANGCQAGKNVVFAIPGGWYDACILGVTGDWVMYAIYRQVNCGAGVGEEVIASGDLAVLIKPEPNPFTSETRLKFVLTEEQSVDLAVYDIHGRRVSTIAKGSYTAGSHSEGWSGKASDGTALSPGMYFISLEAGEFRSTQRVVLGK
ncbi:FlgD immunoglobulin-like domain containing protein [Candidatus Eisenbacteria bacterium]|uniref:FlgD immunoglobulin-like domain containing protein n=1 Tax=Eiseniibacteriota bacterium TaxID=2212470 RepID=A0ABV6YQI7_UNCEI